MVYENPILKNIKEVIMPKRQQSDKKVYFGRGGEVNQNPGNIAFREICRNNYNNYINLGKLEKKGLVNNLLDDFTNDGFKFFDEKDRQIDPSNNIDDRTRILKKISQTIRDTRSFEQILPEPRLKPRKISIDSAFLTKYRQLD